MKRRKNLNKSHRSGKKIKEVEILNRNIDYETIDDDGNTPLHLAFRDGRLGQRSIIKILETLLDQGMDINAKNGEGKTVLHLAIERRYTQVIDFCIERNADLEITHSRGNSVAHFVIEEEKEKFSYFDRNKSLSELEDQGSSFVDWMVSRKIDFFYKLNEKKQSALYLAIEFKLQHIFRTLLKHISDFNSVEMNQKSLLCAFLETNIKQNVSFNPKILKPVCSINYKFRFAYNIVKMILDNNKDLSDETLAMALRTAIFNDQDPKVIRLLLRKTVKVVHRVDDKSLIQAFINNFYRWKDQSQINIGKEILQTLVNKGANINERENDSETVAFKCFRCHPIIEMLQLLEDCGADFSIRTGSGDSFLHLVSQFNNEKGMIGLLEEHKRDVDMLNSKGKTPLQIAITFGNQYIAKGLVDLGAKVNTESKYGKRMLTMACEKGQIKVVKKLIEHGAKFDYRDKNDKTLVHLSLHWPEVIGFLVKNGLDINAKDKWGKTPLHYAKDIAHIKMLIGYGALVDVLDENAHSPLYLAVSTRNSENTFELLKCGADLFDAKVFQMLNMKNVLNNSGELKNHFIKLIAAGMLDETTNAFKEIQLVDDKFFKHCQAEVESLKKYFINDSTSLYDFLHKNQNRRCAYVDNEKLMKHAKITKKFPKYSIIILGCYNEAVARQSILEEATNMLRKITRLNVPDLCSDKIFSPLRNSDLVRFIEACTVNSSTVDAESSFTKSIKKLKIQNND